MKEIIVNNKEAKKYSKKSLFAFIIFFCLIILGYAAWNWLYSSPKSGMQGGMGVQKPLRNVLMMNEQLFGFDFDTSKLIKEYPEASVVAKARANGNVGLKQYSFDTANWRLQILKTNGDTLKLTLDDIKKLPATTVNFNFKCIEGWNQITSWTGVRFSDFVNYYHLNKETELNYVGMRTPDGSYYVGIDMPSVLQKQTILCYELNHQPLPMNQGYPLRLIIPVKYGVKHIKQIGAIFFSNERPADYWAERGYDYYTGH